MPADPFDALRLPPSPRRPRPQFAVALRRRLEQEMGMTTTDTSAVAVASAAGEAAQVRIIHIGVPDADVAMDFFGPLFGWLSERTTVFGDHPAHYIVNTAVLHVLTSDPDAGAVRLWMAVPDVTSTLETIESAGGSASLPSSGRRDSETPVMWAYAADDQGLPLGVNTPSDRYSDAGAGAQPAHGAVGYLTIDLPDGDAGREFFSTVFGWDFVPFSPVGYHHAGNTRLPLGITGGASEPGVTLYMRVADIETSRSAVLVAGGTADTADESPSGLSCACRAPDGTRFALWQPAAGY